MDFKTKYVARSYVLNGLLSLFGFTALVLVYAYIKHIKFQDFSDVIYRAYNLKKLDVLLGVTENWYTYHVYKYLKWIPLTLILDYHLIKVLRKMIK